MCDRMDECHILEQHLGHLQGRPTCEKAVLLRKNGMCLYSQPLLDKSMLHLLLLACIPAQTEAIQKKLNAKKKTNI